MERNYHKMARRQHQIQHRYTMPPHHAPGAWSSHRVQGLLQLFKIRAAPDFREQVLRRVHERQHTVEPQADHRRAFGEAWHQCRAWLRETWHAAPRRMGTALALGSVCLILLGLSVPWWLSSARPSRLGTEPGPHSATPQDGQARFAHADGDRPAPALEARPDAVPAMPLSSIDPQSLDPLTESQAPSSTEALPVPIVPPPAVPPAPWTAMELDPPAQSPPARGSHKRPGPTKSKRLKKTAVVGKQVAT